MGKRDASRRSLTIHRRIVTPGDRTRYLENARKRREHFERANCNFWIFEEAGLTGAFVEFTEGPSRQALTAALASAPEGGGDPARVYEQVELG
jgi:hypothetical protein